MSWRIEFQTEQYLSRERSIARWIGSGGHAAGDREVERDAGESARLLRSALGDETDASTRGDRAGPS